MPIKICTKKGKKGKKWGKSGKCYTGKNASKKAHEQAAAAYASGYKKENNEIESEVEKYLNEIIEDPSITEKERFFAENPPTSEDSPVPWETEPEEEL